MDSKRKIVTDSGCDIASMPDVAYERIPFSIDVLRETHADTPDLDITAFVSAFEAAPETRSACPGPQAWYEAGRGCSEVFMLPTTKEMSGSYNAANAARAMLEDDGTRVQVFDTMQASAGLSVMADHVRTMLLENRSFDEIRSAMSNYKVHMDAALKSLGNLVKNGRVPKVLASAAGLLNLSAIAEARNGVFGFVTKKRGQRHVIDELVARLGKNGFKGGPVFITHCLNPAMAEELKSAIQAAFASARVRVLPASGLCSYYAERGGVLVGYPV